MVVSRQATANPADYGVGPLPRGEHQQSRMVTPDEARHFYFAHIAAGRPTALEHQRLVTTLWYVCCNPVIGAAFLECGDPARSADATLDAYSRAFLWLHRRPDDIPQDVDLPHWIATIARRLARGVRAPLPEQPEAADAPPTADATSARFTTPAQLHAVRVVLGQLSQGDREVLIATDGAVWPPVHAAPAPPLLAQARRRFRSLVVDTLADPGFVFPFVPDPDAQRLRQLFALLVRQDTYPGHVCLNERSLLRHVRFEASPREAARRDEHLRLCSHCSTQLQILAQVLTGFQPHRKDFLLRLTIRLAEANIVPSLRELLEPA